MPESAASVCTVIGESQTDPGIEATVCSVAFERSPQHGGADARPFAAADLPKDHAERTKIDLYYAPTPNGLKVRLFLEEVALAYRIVPVNLSRGEQFQPEFTMISPNNKIPAIVDHTATDGDGKALTLFESGAILLYLAEKIGRFVPNDAHGRAEVLQWLFWQMSGLGPMAGQIGYFNVSAPEREPFAIERYAKETRRLYGVLDRRLGDREFIAGEFSIADVACYPWIVPHRQHRQDIDEFRHLKRWFETLSARPATRRAYAGVENAYVKPGKPVARAASLPALCAVPSPACPI